MSLGDWNEWGQLVLQEIKKLDEKQKELVVQMAEHTVILDQNTKSLEIHIQGVKELQTQNKMIREEIDLRVKPLEEAIQFRKKLKDLFLMICGSTVGIVGFIFTILKLIEYLSK